MNNESIVQQPNQEMPHVTASSYEGQMSSKDLWRMLVRWKMLVFGVVLLTFITVVAKAFFYVPVTIYRAEALLSKPLKSDVLVSVDAKAYSPQKIFAGFVRNLESRDLRLRYFNDNKLQDKFPNLKGLKPLNTEQTFEQEFNQHLSVRMDKGIAKVAFEGTRAGEIAGWVNGFVALANAVTVNNLVDEALSKLGKSRLDQINQLEEKIHALKKEEKWKRQNQIIRMTEAAWIEREKILGAIEALRKKAEKRRLDRIADTRVALRIAQRLGISEVPQGGGDTGTGKPKLPNYYNGSKALEAELDELKKRKTPIEPFLGRLRDMEEALSLNQSNLDAQAAVLRQSRVDNPFGGQPRKLEEQLNQLKADSRAGVLDSSRISAMQIIQAATVPVNPVEKAIGRWLAVLTGLFGGLALGVLAAFFADFIARVREKIATQSTEKVTG